MKTTIIPLLLGIMAVLIVSVIWAFAIHDSYCNGDISVDETEDFFS